MPENVGSSSRRRSRGGGRGQPNDYERAIARRAVDKKPGIDFWNLGGRALGGLLDALQTPQAAVASSIQELSDLSAQAQGEDPRNIQGGGASWGDLVQQTRDNTTMGDVFFGDDRTALESAIGFAFDIATDPLTYTPAGAAKIGIEPGKQAARKFLSKTGIDYFGEQAVKQAENAGQVFSAAERTAEVGRQGKILATRAAMKTLRRPSNQILSPAERKFLGAEKGFFLTIPGSKHTPIDKLVAKIAPERVLEGRSGRAVFKLTDRELGAGRLASRVRQIATQNRVANRLANAFTKRPGYRSKILFGTEDEVFEAFHALEKETVRSLQRRRKDQQWGKLLGETFARAHKAGIDGKDITYAAGGSTDALARIRQAAVEADDEALVDDLTEFMPYLWEDANEIDPNLPWLGQRAAYVPRRPSEEMIALGRDFGWGGRKFETFDYERFYGIEEGLESNFMGEKLLPPMEAKGRSVEQQMHDIARRKGYPAYFEVDAYKSWPEHVKRLASRYGDEVMAKELRDLGVLEPNIKALMRQEGLSWGKRKSTATSMMAKAQSRYEVATANRIDTQMQLRELDDQVQLGADAKATAQAARQEVESEISDIRGQIGLQNAGAIREYESMVLADLGTVSVRRQLLLEGLTDDIAKAQDELFGLEHSVVEQSHQVQLETYRATKQVTKLEKSLADMRDELGDIYERLRLMEGGVDFNAALAAADDMARRAEQAGDVEKWMFYENMKSDPGALRDWAQRNRNLGRFGSSLTLSKDAIKVMEDAEARVIELYANMREAYQTLYQFEELGKMPTKHLQKQAAAAELSIKQKRAELGDVITREFQTPMTNHRRARLMADIEALANVQASALHQLGVIERARGRMAELQGMSPATWADEATDLRFAEALADKTIHTQFPDLPAEVSGGRVRAYFQDRMSVLQENIDGTEGQVMSAFTDRDTMRANLHVTMQRKKEAERKLAALEDSVPEEAKQLARQEKALLDEAEAAGRRALEIGEQQELAGIKIEGLLQQAQSQLEIEQFSEMFLAAMKSKQALYEAQALVDESTFAGAKRVNDAWNKIAKNKLSKEQLNATKSAWKANFHEVGKVSVTQERWLVEAIYGATTMHANGMPGAFLRQYDKMLNWWKAVALSTPGTVIRNMYGGMFNNYLSPWNVDVMDYQKAFQYGVRGTYNNKLRQTVLSAEDRAIFDELEKAGVFVGSGTTLEIERTINAANYHPFSTDFKPVRFMRRRQEDVERMLRGALGYRVMKEGGDIGEALGEIMKYHFDYDDLSAFERSVVRRFVPFYTWTRKNLPLMMEQIAMNPQKFNRFYQAKLEIEDMSPEEQIIPYYFTENLATRLPFGLGQGQAYVLPDLPITSINDVTDPSMALSGTSPLIKAPIEYAFGKQIFKGIPLKDEYQPVPKWLQVIPGVFPALNAVGRAKRGPDGGWYMTQKDMYLFESFIPAYGKARRLFPANDEYSERTLTNWLSFAFGLGIRSNTPQERRNEAFKRVNKEMENISTLRELGYLTEDDREPRFGQTVNAAYQYLGVEKPEEE